MYTSTPYYMYIVIILMTATPNGLIVWPTTPTTHNLLHDLVDPSGDQTIALIGGLTYISILDSPNPISKSEWE